MVKQVSVLGYCHARVAWRHAEAKPFFSQISTRKLNFQIEILYKFYAFFFWAAHTIIIILSFFGFLFLFQQLALAEM